MRVWSNHGLTLIGRNIRAKSFGLSQIVNIFLVLPHLLTSFVKEVESMLSNFSWAESPDKKKWACIIDSIIEGGLEVTHISTFIDSLKCTWV